MSINIAELRSDVLDRMDNLVQGQELPESLRQKLKAPKRVTRALNQALVLFVRDADRASVNGFSSTETLTADANIGTAGVVNDVTTYVWPAEAFEERPDGGLVKIILNDEERYFDNFNNTELESVRYMANSALYGSNHPVFHVDVEGKRIYVPSGVTAGARIIKNPLQINDADQYDGGTTLPISDTFAQTLSEIALQELIKMGGNYAYRNRVLNDTVPAPQQQQQQQEG